MATADRRAHQRDLLDHHGDALARSGGPPLDREELWDRYRAGAPHAYVAPLITAGMGGMQDEGTPWKVSGVAWPPRRISTRSRS